MTHATNSTFMHQFLGVVAAALTPVILTAFISLPGALGWHAAQRGQGIAAAGHMT